MLVQNQINEEFVTKDLPDAMKRLNDLRVSTEHEPDAYGMIAPSGFEQVRALYCEFLAIGQSGVSQRWLESVGSWRRQYGIGLSSRPRCYNRIDTKFLETRDSDDYDTTTTQATQCG